MNIFYDENIDLKIRLFYVLALTACIANTLGYLTNMLLYGMTAATLFPLFCAVIIYAASAYGIKTKKTKIPVVLILVICDLIEFPVLYCSYGFYRLSYMVLGIVATTLFLEDKWRIKGTSALILFDLVFIVWRQRDPAFFAAFAGKENMSSVVITFLIAGSSILMLLSTLLKQYTRQQKCLEEMTKDLRWMANLDPLTHLYNRRYLTQYLEEKKADGENAFSVVLLDIDDFKQINDTYGHMFGDEVLQIFSEILLKHMKGQGLVTRFGGEEFMLVFHTTDQNKIQQVLNGCADDFKEYGMSSKGKPLTFSGGASVFHGEDMLVKLFNYADERLYQAKNTGKRHVVYDV